MYYNLSYNDNFIFNSNAEGVNVYDRDLLFLGSVAISDTSSIYSNNDFLYIATTNSGILYTSIASISGGIFDSISIYKQYPDITNDCVNYIHGSGEYLLITTISGVDRFDVLTNNRIYNETAKEVSKCFQTAAGRFYYVSNNLDYRFRNYGIYKYTLTFDNQSPENNYQIKIELTLSNFGYDRCSPDGSDIFFLGPNGEELPFYIETWTTGGSSIIWVKILSAGTDFIYLVCGGVSIYGRSNPSAVFDLYDTFDYPLTMYSSNLFSLTYGNIVAPASTQPELLYDGATSGYYTYGFPNVGDYVQIEFFIPRRISKLRLWQSSYSTSNDVYFYGSNTGLFSGEEVLLFYRTSNLSTDTTLVFVNTSYYSYYRIVRGAGTSAWQLTEINMFEGNAVDITTISGSPWVYSSNYESFTILENSILTCYSSNDDYIRTDYNLSVPMIIEQRIKLNYSSENTTAYSNFLEPGMDGVAWYPAGTTTWLPYFNGVAGARYYNASQAIGSSWGTLTTCITAQSISVSFEGTVPFYNIWPGATIGGTNKALRLFGAGFFNSVSVAWVRVRKYSLYNPILRGISTPVRTDYKYYLNVIYDPITNWTDDGVDYAYEVDSGVAVNDIFITESTSLYSVTDNVIFIATTEGLIVIEERRGDEINSRLKYIKIMGQYT